MTSKICNKKVDFFFPLGTILPCLLTYKQDLTLINACDEEGGKSGHLKCFYDDGSLGQL